MENAVLLVTANVGSLFDNAGKIEDEWLQQLYKTVHMYKPQFIGLHFQEVGGKNYKTHMELAEGFFRRIKSSEEMKDYDRACIYVDSDYKVEETFTALGSLYFIHKSLKNISQYNFEAKRFRPVSGEEVYGGSLNKVATVEKEKFPRDFWSEITWSRKGFMRTRWIIHNYDLDLVNVHLFHDVSNLAAYKASPSIYSGNRKKALEHVINRISNHQKDNQTPLPPFFLFGDFNFRLDTHCLVKQLCKSAEMEIHERKENQLQKIIWEKKDNDHKVLLQIEDKLFVYPDQKVFRNNCTTFLKYDKEVAAFHNDIREEDITFPPSYPYSENHDEPTNYMNTRCPAWCDRILMSHSAQKLIDRGDDETSVDYNTMGPTVCMGDHKPVFLSFKLRTDRPSDHSHSSTTVSET